MNLQTQRQLEQFARLVDLPLLRIEPRMEFALPPLRLYLEVIEDRLWLTLARRVGAENTSGTLEKMLAACHPGLLQGIPVRAYTVRDMQLLTCAPPPDSDSRLWMRCYKVMRRLLDANG